MSTIGATTPDGDGQLKLPIMYVLRRLMRARQGEWGCCGGRRVEWSNGSRIGRYVGRVLRPTAVVVIRQCTVRVAYVLYTAGILYALAVVVHNECGS